MNRSSFVLESRRGGTIRGDLRSVGGVSPSTAVVVVHGFKGFKDWGFFPHLASCLAEEGHSAISFNFSHNGIGADPEVLSELDLFSRNTFTREVEELGHVLEATSSGALTGEKPGGIGLLGHSRGGATSILAAARFPRVSALVTWGAVDHLDRWSPETVREWRTKRVVHVLNQRTGQRLPLSLDLWEDFQENRESLDVLGAAGSLNVPWLLVHGTEDATVPVVEGERLANSSPVAALHRVSKAGHTFEATHPFAGPTRALEEALRVTLAHFRNSLGGAQPSRNGDPGAVASETALDGPSKVCNLP